LGKFFQKNKNGCMAIITLDTLQQNICRNRSAQMETEAFKKHIKELEENLEALGFSIDYTVNDIHDKLRSYDKLKKKYQDNMKGVSDETSYRLNNITTPCCP
jgi:hypothetical protein